MQGGGSRVQVQPDFIELPKENSFKILKRAFMRPFLRQVQTETMQPHHFHRGRNFEALGSAEGLHRFPASMTYIDNLRLLVTKTLTRFPF